VIRSTSRSVLAGLIVVSGLALAGCGAGQVAQTAQQRPTVDGQGAQVGPIAIRYAALEYPTSGVYEQGSTARLRMVVVNTGDQSDTLTSVRSNVSPDVTISQGTSPAATGSASAAPSLSPSPTGSASFSPSPTPGGTASGTPTGQAEPPQSSVSAGSGAPSQGPSASASGSATASGSASPSGSASAGASPTPSASAGEQSAQIQIPPNGYVLFTGDGPSVLLTGLTQQLRPAQNLSVTFTFQNAGSTTVTIAVATPEGQISLAPTVSVSPNSESEG
jgi:copper(I)-binding protein